MSSLASAAAGVVGSTESQRWRENQPPFKHFITSRGISWAVPVLLHVVKETVLRYADPCVLESSAAPRSSRMEIVSYLNIYRAPLTVYTILMRFPRARVCGRNTRHELSPYTAGEEAIIGELSSRNESTAMSHDSSKMI